MKIKKTRGTTLEGGPTTYEISTECGKIFEAVKTGSRWACEGAFYPSIKSIKVAIELWDEEEEAETQPEAEYEGNPLWSGVCPVCYWIHDRPNDLEPLTPLEKIMCDNAGLLLPDGTPDIEYAAKEVDRALKYHAAIRVE